MRSYNYRLQIETFFSEHQVVVGVGEMRALLELCTLTGIKPRTTVNDMGAQLSGSLVNFTSEVASSRYVVHSRKQSAALISL